MRNSADYGSRSSLDEGDELDVLVRKASLDSAASRPSLSTSRDGYLYDDDLESHTRRRSSKNSTHHRSSRYAGLLRSTVNLSLLLGLALAVFVGYWVVKFLLLRHDAYAHAVFANPLIPKGEAVEPRVQPFGLAEKPSREAVQTHLDKRLLELSAPPSTLSCTWTAAEEAKYAALPSGGPYFFALNLYNNQVVLPTLARTLLDLAHFLGTTNTHISIFENGSTDNTTLALAHFAAALTSAGISHTIVSDSRKTDWKKVDRIAQLSVYRNYALSPVNGTLGAEDGRERSFEEVVFINDVFVCPRDALELLWQRKKQNAHAACAMDWRATQSWFGWLGFKSVKFYDNWVSRTITGDMLRSRFDTLAETRDGIEELFDQPGSEISRELFSKGLPVPVYSCWNGMLALPAAPFRGANGPATLFRSTFNEPGQCAASECKTLARDFWAQGLNRWMIVPSVHVSYAQDVYSHPSLADLTRRSELNAQSTSSIIDWEPLKPPESVVCYSWVRGFHIDLPYRRTREAPFR